MQGDSDTPFDKTVLASDISRRSLLRGAGAGAAALVLAACSRGNSSQGSTAEPVAGGTPSPAAGGTPSAAASLSPVDIEFLNWHTGAPDEGLGKAFTDAKNNYEEAHPGFGVNFEATPFDTYAAALSTRIQSDNMSDIAVLLPGLNNEAAWPGVRLLTETDVGSLFDVLSGWGAASTGEGFFGIPFGTQGVLLYYSKPLFETAGLDPEAPPQTWEAFSEACDTLKAAGIGPLGISGSDSFTPWWLWSALAPQYFPDADALDKIITGETALNDEGFVKSLEYVQQTFDRGWWHEGYAEKQFTDVGTDFTTGEVAFVPGLIGDILNWASFDQSFEDKYGVMSAPVLPDAPAGKQVTFASASTVLCFGQDSEKYEAAQQFIEYLTSSDAQTQVLKTSGQFPNRDDVDVSAATQSAGATQIAKVLDSTDTVAAPQTAMKGPVTGTVFQKLTTSIVDNDIQALLDDIAQQQTVS